MRSLRHRRFALLGLAAYGLTALAVPMAHLANHRNDHTHGPGDTIVFAAVEPDAEHVAFDADLAAIDLSDAGHFGVASVDCELSRYTLAACDDPSAPPHSFGDELIARAPHHHERPFDPDHGAHSTAHFGLALLATAPFLLPPPSLPEERLVLPCEMDRPGSPPALALRARAPPLPLV